MTTDELTLIVRVSGAMLNPCRLKSSAALTYFAGSIRKDINSTPPAFGLRHGNHPIARTEDAAALTQLATIRRDIRLGGPVEATASKPLWPAPQRNSACRSRNPRLGSGLLDLGMWRNVKTLLGRRNGVAIAGRQTHESSRKSHRAGSNPAMPILPHWSGLVGQLRLRTGTSLMVGLLDPGRCKTPPDLFSCGTEGSSTTGTQNAKFDGGTMWRAFPGQVEGLSDLSRSFNLKKTN